ncbi:DUF6286 domain-containing protein [Streptomyces sp. NPDC059753]|uniref:DUF6286 domain-containing protein n=1 Tax=Streptomyces sp. NPDC059753 TaxID=3346933 RepID=UPI0036517A84
MLLFDICWVRAGNPAAPWRINLARELAARPIQDTWILTGAAIAAALGLLLILTALTPGLRHLLPMTTPSGTTTPLKAALERDGAALLLRDAALRVPGVSRARIRIRRHRIKARIDARFRDPEDVKADLKTALSEQRDQLALAHSPRIKIRVRRHQT